MATRFYFSATDFATIATTPHANWEQLPSPVPAYMMKTSPEGRLPGGIQTLTSANKSSATAPYDFLLAQWYSKPLPAAGTLSGTFDLTVHCLEINTSLDFMLQCMIRVVSGDGLTVRGTAYAGATQSSVVTTAGAQNQEMSGVSPGAVRYWSGIALSNVAYQAGDRILVELGARSTAAVSGQGFTLAIGDVEDFSLTAGDYPQFTANVSFTLTAPARSWIQFSQNLWGTPGVEEYKFIEEGVLLNTGATVPFVDITNIEGLDATDVRQQQHDREGIHGAYVTAEFESARTITIEGNIYANPTATEAYLDTLKANYEPTRRDRKFLFSTDDGNVRFIWGKSLGIKFAKTSSRGQGVVPFQLQIACQDPRIYALDEITFTGVSHNPATLSTIDVAGNRDVPAIIRFFGAVSVGDSLILRNRYGQLIFTFTSALTANDYLYIDLDKRQVIKNYKTNARDAILVTGNWIPLSAGRNALYAGHTGSAYSYSILYRPAWR